MLLHWLLEAETSFVLHFIYLFYVFECFACVCVYVCVQNMALGTLKLPIVVSYHMALEIKHKTSGRAASALSVEPSLQPVFSILHDCFELHCPVWPSLATFPAFHLYISSVTCWEFSQLCQESLCDILSCYGIHTVVGISSLISSALGLSVGAALASENPQIVISTRGP